MKTQQEFVNWLKDDTASRCILAEVYPKFGGVETKLYWSDTGFTTKPTDVPANTEYRSLIIGGVGWTEQVNVSGSSNPTSFGGIEIENVEGDNDTFINGIWLNGRIELFFGDSNWAREDFQPIFKGAMDSLSANGRNRWIVPILDKLKFLDTPLTETLIGGTGDNKDRVEPTLLGEAFNFEPVLIDAATHRYRYNLSTTTSEGPVEVRDDGVPVSYTTPSAGVIQLNASPKGQITMGAQGDNVGGYTNTIAGIIKKLVKSYGLPALRFTDADLDLTNLNTYDAAHQDPVCLFNTEPGLKVIDACQRLASSLGTMVTTSRLGQLQLLQLVFPVLETPLDVTAADMVDGSLKVVDILDVEAAVALGFCQNHSSQSTLTDGIPEAHRKLYKDDWRQVTRSDSQVALDYKTHKTPDQEDTCLVDEDSATAETLRRLGIRKVPRVVFEYKGYSDSLFLQRGQAIRITDPRFGLQAGKTGRVVQLKPDFKNARCIVQVMI